jgi:hypothetical protein
MQGDKTMTPIDIETDVEQVARLNKSGARGIIVPVFNASAGTIVRLIPVFDGVDARKPLCDREDLDTTNDRLYKKFGDSGTFHGGGLPKVGDTVIIHPARGSVKTPYVLQPEDIGPDDDLEAMLYSPQSSFEDEMKAIVARYPEKLVDYALLAEVESIVIKKGGDLTNRELGRDISGDEKINWHLMGPLEDANNGDLRNTDVAILTLKALQKTPLPGAPAPNP